MPSVAVDTDLGPRLPDQADTAWSGSRAALPLTLTIARRLAASLLVLLTVSFVVFSFIHLAPGGPEQALAGRLNSTPEVLHAIRVRYGLDQPFLTQYWTFLKHAATLDFGQSIQTRQAVLPEVIARLGVTGPLVLLSFVLTVIVGGGLGVLAAYRRGTTVDRAAVSVAVLAASMPAFVTSIVLLYVVSLELGVLPSSGAGSGVFDRFEHLILPALTMTIGASAAMLKLTRTIIAKVLEEDHVAFAYARGLSTWKVFRTHVLRNAGGQLVAVGGVLLVSLLVTTTVVETVFGLRGIGAYLVQAVEVEDLPVVQCISILTTLLIILVNLGTDALNWAIDPRSHRAD